jgi:hypothetical protein
MKRRELGPALRSLHPIATFGVQRLYYFCCFYLFLRFRFAFQQTSASKQLPNPNSTQPILQPGALPLVADSLGRLSESITASLLLQAEPETFLSRPPPQPYQPRRTRAILRGTTFQPLASLHGKSDTSNALRSTTSVEKPGKLLKSTQDRMATGEVASRNSAAAVSPKPLPSNLVR